MSPLGKSVKKVSSPLLKQVKRRRNAKAEANPSLIPTQILERRSVLMANFAKQFQGVNLADRTIMQKLKQFRYNNKMRKIYNGEFTPEVMRCIDNYVLPHFYKNAGQTMAILSMNHLDTWNRYIWKKFVKYPGKPLHALMKSDKALCSYMRTLINLRQPHEALTLYTDHIRNKLDKMAITPAIQALAHMKQWDDMRNLFRVIAEKRPSQIDHVLVKTIVSPLSRQQEFDQVLPILQTYIKEINDQTEIVIMTPLYQCQNERDMKKLLQWCINVKKNVDTKRDKTIHMFESAKSRWPNLREDFNRIIQQIKGTSTSHSSEERGDSGNSNYFQQSRNNHSINLEEMKQVHPRKHMEQI